MIKNLANHVDQAERSFLLDISNKCQ